MGAIKEKEKIIYSVGIGGVLILLLFLRIYRIATVPLGLHIDEAGLGLNAWSIANYGTDRYGNFMPVCPSNFYGEQSAFYTYFCALFVKFFGLNMYSLRLPGVVMGILAAVFGALLMKERWGWRGMLAGLLLTGIFPYFIMNCRFALDCNAMLGMLTLSLYGLVRLLKKAQRNPQGRLYLQFALVGFLFGVTLYTYIIAAIAIAAFCGLFGLYYLFYRKENRFWRLRQLLCMALPLCLLTVPLLLVVLVNYFDLDPIVTPFFSIPKMAENRTEEIVLSASGMAGKARSLLHVLTSDGKYGSSDRYWTMYRCSVPFVVIGGLRSMFQSWKDQKNRKLGMDMLMLSVVFSEVLLFVLCGTYNYHINGIFVALAYFCVSGIFFLLEICRKPPYKLVCATALIALYGISFVGFAREYFAPPASAFQVYGGASGALSLLTDAQREREIYILDEVADFYFLSNPIPPTDFSANCNALGYVEDYQNLHFHDPVQFSEDDILVCNKGSGRRSLLSDPEVTGVRYSVMETEHYCVFYHDSRER